MMYAVKNSQGVLVALASRLADAEALARGFSMIQDRHTVEPMKG